MKTLPKSFKVNYVVLHLVNSTYESTYFATHARAFAWCEGLEHPVKAVYGVKSVKPMTLTPLNVWGGREFHGAQCPIFQMQRHFMQPDHNINFTV